MKFALIALPVLALGMTACADRSQPGGSSLDPLCMPDGSVVWYEYKKKDGSYDETTAKKENCPWFKK